MSANMTLDELKTCELDILKVVHNFCVDNNIRYYLGYGTCLGAVRHHGFIPWDDDIDIVMYRKDYNYFEEHFNEYSDRYKLLSVTTNKNYTLPLPKVVDLRTELHQTNQRELMHIGVYIDVFILDNVPVNRIYRSMLYKRLSIYQYLWGFCQSKPIVDEKRNPKNILKNLLIFLLKGTNPRIFSVKLNKISNITNNSKFCANLLFTAYGREKETYDKSYYGEGTEIPFEGNMFIAPIQFDAYLRQLYGNYMELPPEEKRVSNHLNIAFFKE